MLPFSIERAIYIFKQELNTIIETPTIEQFFLLFVVSFIFNPMTINCSKLLIKIYYICLRNQNNIVYKIAAKGIANGNAIVMPFYMGHLHCNQS